MLGAWRNGSERPKGGDFDGGGYMETDPTGRYRRYKDVLGKGAMKTVYRAFDELQGIEVAWNQARICDVLRSPEAVERLYSEVHLLATLKHDSIISFHSSWADTENRTFNFITEMFTSGTLREYRQRYRHVDIRAVKNWARQILHGLVYLHSHDPPVIHRDLKCDNVFVNGHLGQVKIGDLGLAAVLKGSQQAHSVIGTPEFMAPELYDEEYNELVDTYSFGMCVLEMLTGEYPYCECSNPAQIYKKVTSGRLPNAFYEIKDPEAQLFIGRCLENVSKRPSAWELLLDPFLQFENAETPSHLETGISHALSECQVPLPSSPIGQKKKMSTEMKITGKINPDDDTIYLRVQIADKNGSATNVYFPFDINVDTPIDVADEMVKELEIMDRGSSLIAEVIDREISSLVPHWKNEVPADIYNYHEEDDSFHNSPSSATSSQGSSFSRMHPVVTECRPSCDWLQDMFDDDDDTVSQTSTYSGKYTYVNYSSGYEQDYELSPQRRETPPPQSNKSSRFCHTESTRSELYCSNKPLKECSFFLEPPLPLSHAGKRSVKSKLLRNRSFVDIRSQLLHRSLVQELNNRLSKTVGSVESIHYPDPIEVPYMEENLLGACK